MQRIQNFVEYIVNSNNLHIVDRLDVISYFLIHMNSTKQGAISIRTHADVRFAFHINLPFCADRWKHTLFEENEVLLLPSKEIVFLKELKCL